MATAIPYLNESDSEDEIPPPPPSYPHPSLLSTTLTATPISMISNSDVFGQSDDGEIDGRLSSSFSPTHSESITIASPLTVTVGSTSTSLSPPPAAALDEHKLPMFVSTMNPITNQAPILKVMTYGGTSGSASDLDVILPSATFQLKPVAEPPPPPPPPAATVRRSQAAVSPTKQPPPPPPLITKDENEATTINTSTVPQPIAAAEPITSPSESLSSSLPVFSLSHALELIHSDTPALALELEAKENDLLETRSSMITLSRQNFILERDLVEIDEKIKLLIKNRITVQEVMTNVTSSTSNNQQLTSHSPALSLFKSHQTLYEDLFYLLQSHPKYFARLSRLLQPGKDSVEMFVQTVVLDTYGDAFDMYEEGLLLSLFKQALSFEISSITDRATLLRSNTPLTQMLSAYAKRGQGLGVLREVLQEPLHQLCDIKSTGSKKEINLEIQPIKILQQYIIDYETETGQIWTSPNGAKADTIVTDEAASQLPEVQSLLTEHLQSLLSQAGVILTRIFASAKKIPYGMRWICRELGTLYRQRFQSSTESSSVLSAQIRALQGGFIFLRFFNPIIVAPEALNFITNAKPSKIMRRNLVLIAKLLQNLSNGLLFTEKEAYMRVVNPWLQEQFPKMERFFEEVIEGVEEIQEEIVLEKYLHSSLTKTHGHGRNGRASGSAKTPQITLSLIQIFFIHRLCYEYKDKICLGSAGHGKASISSSTTNSTYSAIDPLAVLLMKFNMTTAGGATAAATASLSARRESILSRLGSLTRPSSHSKSTSTTRTSTAFDSTLIPATLPKQENINVTLRLVQVASRAQRGVSVSEDMFGGHVDNADGSLLVLHDPFGRNHSNAPETNPLYMQSKTLLLSVLKKLSAQSESPASSARTLDEPYPTLISYLHAHRQESLEQGNTVLYDSINNILSMLSTIYNMKLLNNLDGTRDIRSLATDVKEQAYDFFLHSCLLDAEYRQTALRKLGKQSKKIQEAFQIVEKHQQYLQARLEIYQVYLANVKQGQGNKDHRSDSSTTKAKDYATKTIKFSHAELLSMNLLHSLDGDHSDSILKHLQYRLEMRQPTRQSAPRFFLSVRLKKGVTIEILPQPVELEWEELLRLQEHGEKLIRVEEMELNVNVLVHVLKKEFLNQLKC